MPSKIWFIQVKRQYRWFENECCFIFVASRILKDRHKIWAIKFILSKDEKLLLLLNYSCHKPENRTKNRNGGKNMDMNLSYYEV